jgi:hypothetical protein
MRAVRILICAAFVALNAGLSCSPTLASTRETVTVRSDLEALLMKGAFDELEAIASDYRRNRAREVGGGWAIESYYGDLSAISGVPNCNCATHSADNGFDDKRKQLESWLKAKPGSLTARVALAELWLNYAWLGRGTAFANQTREDQWRLFKERVAQTVDIIKTVNPDDDLEIYRIEFRLTQTYEQPRQKLDETYARATHAFPDVPDFAADRAYYLLPRWFGEPGETGAFMRELLADPDSERGLNNYFTAARVILGAENRFASLLQVSGVSYADLVKSFASRAATFGVSKIDMNVMMYYAVAAQDKKTVTLLAGKIGDGWSRSIWSDKKYFDGAVAWASS